jgi:hypothetical protein
VSAAEWTAIAIAAAALVVTLAVLVALRGLGRSVAQLQGSIDDLAAGAATIEQLRAAVAGEPEPPAEPDPVVVSRVPPVLRTRSVVKAMALGTGTAHAARRLRNGRSS